MAVIKCKNCENDILDTEIVCPYCDSPVNSEVEVNDDGSQGSKTGDETLKIATSKDFEKEKESFLKTILAESRQGFEDTDVQEPSDASQETVKIPTKEFTYRPSTTGTQRQRRPGGARSSYYQKKEKKKKRRRMIIAVCAVLVVVAGLIWLISALLGGGGNSSSEVTSASDAGGYIYSEASRTLTITDGSVLSNYTATSEKPWDSVGEIKYLEIASGITEIGEYAFSGMNIEKVTLPKTLKKIGTGAFYNCASLSNVAFNSDIKELVVGSRAFARCTSLKSVDLPEGVSKIEAHAFIECTSLETVTVNGKNTKVDLSAFDGCDKIKTVWCHADSDAEAFAQANDIEIEYLGKNPKKDKDEDEDEDKDEEEDEDEDDKSSEEDFDDEKSDDDSDKKDSDKKDSDKKDSDKKDSDKKDSDKKDSDKKDSDKKDSDKKDSDKKDSDKNDSDTNKTEQPSTDTNGTDIAPDAYEDFNGGNFESQEDEDEFYKNIDDMINE